MDREIQKVGPDYKRIYTDILNSKYPEKTEECKFFLSKSYLSALDIIELNKKVFGIDDRSTVVFNQKHRSYDRSSILEILDYQKKHKLNNSQLADHFRLSRNTVSKWKKLFLI